MSQQVPQVKTEPGIKKEPGTENNEEWQTIPLKSYGPEDVDENTRIHIMKLISRNDVNIVKDFEKPVRLHRKDPRNMQFHLTRQELDQRKREKEEAEKQNATKQETKKGKGEGKDKDKGKGKDKENENENGGENRGVNEKEQEEGNTEGDGKSDVKSDKAKEEIKSKIAPEEGKLMRGQADLSQVAPDGGARKNKKNLFKRKTKQINLMDEAKRKLRYEEHYPWVIEDYTGKNVYVGNYEAGSTELLHVLFVFDKDGFKMIPAEKVYRFTPRNKYATLTLEEAEQKMEKNSSVPRWLMKHIENDSIAEGSPDQRFRNNSPSANGRVINDNTRGRRMRTVIGGSSSSGHTNSGSGKDRDSDHDDLDFEEEFADDEEAPIMDGDEEENKMSERKIKKEMLRAAHLNADEDADVEDDLDDLFETEKSRKVDKEGKKLKKMLNKREGGIYDSDDEERELLPYLSKSDLESDEESDNEIKVKQEPNQEEAGNGANSGPGAGESVGPAMRHITAAYLGDGFVTILAPKEFLSTFPAGDWVPNGRKRPTSPIGVEMASPQKKSKTVNVSSSDKDKDIDKDKDNNNNNNNDNNKENENNALMNTVTVKREPSREPVSRSASPVNAEGSTYDLNDAGPSNLLVTVNEILSIVKDRPLTTKELLLGLKNRISAHADNKQRIIAIVKQNLKLVDGKLALRE